MRIFFVYVLFFFSLILGSIIFPALFGFKENFLVFVAFIAPMVYLGLTSQLIIYEVVLSLLLQLFWGYGAGAIAVPLMATLFIFYGVGKVVNVKIDRETSFSMAGIALDALTTLIFVAIFWVLSANFSSLMQNKTLDPQSIWFFLSNIKILVVIYLESIVYIIALKFILTKRKQVFNL